MIQRLSIDSLLPGTAGGTTAPPAPLPPDYSEGYDPNAIPPPPEELSFLQQIAEIDTPPPGLRERQAFDTPNTSLEFDITPEDPPELIAWRTENQQRLDAALLDWDSVSGNLPDLPGRNPEHARKLALVEAYIHLAQDGKRPGNPLAFELTRDHLAETYFGGRGIGDSMAFYEAIREDAQQRKDTGALLRELADEAIQAELAAAVTDQPASRTAAFQQFTERIAQHPGYRPTQAAEYFAQFNNARRAQAGRIEPFREQLTQVWQSMEGGETSFWDIQSDIPEDQREDFKTALGLLARSMPADEQRNFLSNLGEQVSRDYPNLTIDAYRGLGDFIYQGGTEHLFGSDLEVAQAKEREQAIATERRRRWDFLHDIRQIAEGQYDPIETLAKEGSVLQAIESGAYSTPGVFYTTVLALAPGAGPVITGGLIKEDFYQTTRTTLIEQGVDPALASEYASGLSTAGALPAVLLEQAGAKAVVGKIPGVNKALSALSARLTSRVANLTARAGALATFETGIENTQDLIPDVLREATGAFNEHIPGVDWEKRFENYGHHTLTTFVSILPLSLIGAGVSMSRESKRALIADYSDTELLSAGFQAENIKAIRDAKTPLELDEAIQAAEANIDPNSESAIEATQERAENLQRQQEATERAISTGLLPTFTRTPAGWEVTDPETGQSLGTATTAAEALEIANQRTEAIDLDDADQTAYLATLLEAGDIVATENTEERQTTTNFRPGQRQTIIQEIAENPKAEAQILAQLAAREALAPGTGGMAEIVLGRNENEFAGRVRNTVNRINKGASVLTVFHEDAHGYWKEAQRTGRLTRDDAVSFLTALDQTLKPEQRLLPANPAQITDTAIDEAIAELMEAEILRTRKGGGHRNLPAGLVTRNLTALLRTLPQAAQKFSAFLRAARAYFKQVFARAIQIKRALADGSLDQQQYDDFLDNLLGLTDQTQLDQARRDTESELIPTDDIQSMDAIDTDALGREAEAAAIAQESQTGIDPTDDITIDDSVPFSLGYGIEPLAPETARQIRAHIAAGEIADALQLAEDNEPSIAAELVSGTGNGWNAELNMSNNAAAALDQGKLMEPDFKEWLAEILSYKTLPAKVLRDALHHSGYNLPEWHHVGSRRDHVSFYDPELISQSSRFWLGIANGLGLKSPARPIAIQEALDALDYQQRANTTPPSRSTLDNSRPYEAVAKELADREAAIARRKAAGKDTVKRENSLAEFKAKYADVLAQKTPAQSADAERNGGSLTAGGSAASGLESRQSPERETNTPPGNSSTPYSLAPSGLADALRLDAVSRIKDPERRAKAFQRLAQLMEDQRLAAERIELEAGVPRLKKSLVKEARVREALRREELENEALARHHSILSQPEQATLAEQPIHAWLAKTKKDGSPDPLHGTLKSPSRAREDHPDLFRSNSGLYDGAEGLKSVIYGGNMLPDEAAKELHSEGLLKDDLPDTLWEAIAREQRHVETMKEHLRVAKEDLREAKAEAKAETNLWLEEQGAVQGTVYSEKAQIIRTLGALDAIMNVLPADVRGKIGGYTQLARIASPELRLKFLQERMAKADKELTAWLRQKYSEEFQTLLRLARPQKAEAGEKPRGKITAELHELFRQVEEAMTLNGPEVEAIATSLETRAALEETSADDEAVLMQTANMIRLAGAWHEADAARREQALIEGTRLYTNGLNQAKIENSIRRDQREARRQIAQQETGKEGDKLELDRRARTDATLRGKARQLRFGLYSFKQTLQAVFGHDSQTAAHFADWERAAADRKSDAIQNKQDQLEKLLESLAGGSFKGEQLRHKLSHNTIKAGNRELSELQAITATLMWRQEDGRRHMEGKLDDAGRPIGDWHYDQAFIDTLESQLSPEAKALRHHIASQYAAEYDRLNPIFRDLYGVDLPRKKHYSPLTVAPAHAGKDNQIADALGQVGLSPASLTPGALRTRSTSAVAEPVFGDALQTYLAHTMQMEHWMAYAPMVTEAAAVLNKRETGDTITEKGGNDALRTLRDWVDYFTQGGNADAAAYIGVNRALTSATNRVSGAILIGKASVLAIQITQLGAGLAKMPTGSYLKRLGKLLTGQLAWKTALQSEYIKRRLDQMPPAVAQAMAGLTTRKPNRLKSLVREIGKSIAGADALFTAGTYAMVYDYHYKHAPGNLTATHQRADYARQQAEAALDDIAQPTRPGTRSILENRATNPAHRLLWAFASEARQKLMLTAYAIAEKRSKSEIARAIAVTWLIGGGLASIIRAAMRDARSDDDDELLDERNWDPKRLAIQTIAGPFNGIPVVGAEVETFAMAATGERPFESGNLLSMGKDMGRTVNDLIEGDIDTLDETLRALETSAEASSVVSGTGSAATSLMHTIRDIFNIADNIEGPD